MNRSGEELNKGWNRTWGEQHKRQNGTRTELNKEPKKRTELGMEPNMERTAKKGGTEQLQN